MQKNYLCKQKKNLLFKGMEGDKSVSETNMWTQRNSMESADSEKDASDSLRSWRTLFWDSCLKKTVKWQSATDIPKRFISMSNFCKLWTDFAGGKSQEQFWKWCPGNYIRKSCCLLTGFANRSPHALRYRLSSERIKTHWMFLFQAFFIFIPFLPPQCSRWHHLHS